LKDFLLQLDSGVIFEDLTLNRKPASSKFVMINHGISEEVVYDKCRAHSTNSRHNGY
jgi:hypothetical protein